MSKVGWVHDNVDSSMSNPTSSGLAWISNIVMFVLICALKVQMYCEVQFWVWKGLSYLQNC